MQVDPEDSSRLIPLMIAGGGGGMADLSSENLPDAVDLVDEVTINTENIYTIAASPLIWDRLEI